MEKSFLNKFIGFAPLKEELSQIVDWYSRYDHFSDDISLPQGIIFYGEPGSGKSYLSNLLAKYFKQAYFFPLNSKNDVNKDLNTLFDEARKGPKPAIIIFEELDLLIDKDSSVTRTLQDQLDGHNSNKGIFVIATTNDIYSIPAALKRIGRFNYNYCLDDVSYEDKVELISHYFDYADFSDQDIAYLASIFNSSVSTLKAWKTEAKLRLGNHPNVFDVEMLLDQIDCKSFVTAKSKDYQVALHESGHMLLAYHYRKYFSMLAVSLLADDISDGKMKFHTADNCTETSSYLKAQIMISLGGYMANRVSGGTRLGLQNDFEKAYALATDLITKEGYDNPSDFILGFKREKWDYSTAFNNQKVNKIDKKVRRLITKLYRKGMRIMKKGKYYLYKIADELLLKGHININDVERIYKSPKDPLSKFIKEDKLVSHKLAIAN